MDSSYLFYLSSGLFLGWSLGANDAANIFGTAVGSRMIKFTPIAVIAAIFVVLGAVFGGAGASETLESLGAVNALAGSFMVALSAALAVYLVLRMGVTVSTSQAIVGAIVGWNYYAGKPTDYGVLSEIVATWGFCPLISGMIAVLLYLGLKKLLKCMKLHLLTQDQLTRCSLVITAAVGAYALGANNIANVVGVFVKSCPFKPLKIGSLLTLSPEQVLFFLGSLAVGVGILTYSKKVIMTIGNNLMKMSPMIALIVVLSQSIVLLLFSSMSLHDFLEANSLPALPLVPVSSTQAVIGSILGIGLVKGGRGINWGIVRKIICGWFMAPIVALSVCFICLFFLENVFNLTVYLPN
ncbi:MAG: inorganic phosphate transporter family protein [Alphaproteobacteria bacterium]|nr:inorganic phosphate transporter family protein [Alphaproteobacteria bacterium]